MFSTRKNNVENGKIENRNTISKDIRDLQTIQDQSFMDSEFSLKYLSVFQLRASECLMRNIENVKLSRYCGRFD